jgi:hypothetical protein
MSQVSESPDCYANVMKPDNDNEKTPPMQGARVIILTGAFKGREGVCLGQGPAVGLWAVSPDSSTEIVSLAFEKDFALLVDLSSDPTRN